MIPNRDRMAAELFAMSTAWDEAHACLSRRDNAGFDAAMRIFRSISQQSTRDGSEPKKPLPVNK